MFVRKSIAYAVSTYVESVCLLYLLYTTVNQMYTFLTIGLFCGKVNQMYVFCFIYRFKSISYAVSTYVEYIPLTRLDGYLLF